MEQHRKEVLMFLCGLAFGGLLGVCMFAGQSISGAVLKKEAIEHGFAEYNAKTGIWQWKNSPEK